MKKIFIIISVVVLMLSCKTQAQVQYSMVTQIYQNYLQYQNYITNGPVNKAQYSGEVLTRGISLWDGYVAGALTGRAGIMDSCHTAFETLYGKSFYAPEISLGALSYLKTDSLSFDDGISWVHYIYPKDSTTKWIDAAVDGLGAGTGNGDVNLSGTPVKHQLAEWINDSTIKGGIYIIDSLYSLGIGTYALNSHTTSIGSSALGNDALRSTTTGNYIIGIGKNAGRYNTTQSYRIYIGSIDRANIKGDTTKTPIYIYEDTDTLKQRIDINGKMEVSSTLNVLGNFTSPNVKDTVKVQSMINTTAHTVIDTLDHVTATQLSDAIGAISPSGDSSWIRITTDTSTTKVLKLNKTGVNYITNISQGTAGEVLFKSDNTTSVAIVSTGIQGYGVSAPQMNNAGIRFLPNAGDVNTGFSWLSSDKVCVTTGGYNAITAAYSGGKKIIYIGDSAYSDGSMTTKRMYVDSIYTANGWHKYLISINALPADSSLIGITPNGTPFTWTINGGVITGSGGIENPDSLIGMSKWIREYDSTNTYYQLTRLNTDTAYFGFDCSDETTALTGSAGNIIYTVHTPFSGTLVKIKANVTTAPTGQPILVDIHNGGTTILSTKVMIDASETTSLTATTPYVISAPTLLNDATLDIYTDQVGSSVHGTGLKLLLYIIRN